LLHWLFVVIAAGWLVVPSYAIALAYFLLPRCFLLNSIHSTHTHADIFRISFHTRLLTFFLPPLSHAIPSSSSSENTTDDDFGVVVAGGLF